MGDLVQLSMFIVSAVDPPWRDNRDAMTYPLLSLQKRRTQPIEYRRNDVAIEVHAPAKFGIATIWDWDLIIFAASHLNQAIEEGRKPSPRIAFAPHDCLKQIGRPTSGRDYGNLAEAIRRLRATTIITNVRFDDAVGDDGDVVPGEERPFSWLTDYRLPKKYRSRVYKTPDNITHITPHDHQGEADPTRPWEIKLSQWLYRAIVRQRDLLAVHPDYFELTGGIERWLYRLARKAVPEKTEPPEFRFRLETLFEVSGLTGRLRDFRGAIGRIAAEGRLPEYSVRIERDGQHELVTLYRDDAKPGRKARIKQTAGPADALLKDFAELKQRLADPKPKSAGPLKADITLPDGTRVLIKPPSSADPEAAMQQLNYYLQQLGARSAPSRS